jgi:hypothetical protein
MCMYVCVCVCVGMYFGGIVVEWVDMCLVWACECGRVFPPVYLFMCVLCMCMRVSVFVYVCVCD